MRDARTVANYVLRRFGRKMSTYKLQKLVFYSHAWSLVWDEAPLVRETFKAWARGPVVPALYHSHRGLRRVSAEDVDGFGELSAEQMATVDRVVDFYGRFSGDQLAELSHREAPWRGARGDLSSDDKASPQIPDEEIRRYFGSLDASHRELPKSYLRGLEWLLSVPEDEVDDMFDVDPNGLDDLQTLLAAE